MLAFDRQRLEILTAAKALHQGQLVKDEYFTLFESVGALEVSLRLLLPSTRQCKF